MPTPGSAAPVPSLTRPKISPVLIWALAGENTIATRHTKHAIRNSLIRILRDYTTRAKRRESVKMSVERIKGWFHNRLTGGPRSPNSRRLAARGESQRCTEGGDAPGRSTPRRTVRAVGAPAKRRDERRAGSPVRVVHG